MTLSTASANRLRLLRAVVVISIALGCYGRLGAEPEKPTAHDRWTAFGVIKLLKTDHLTKHPLDDEISQRCLKTLLKDLDPWKIYFSQKDIDEFTKGENQLDDLAKSDPKAFLNFAFNVFGRLLERVDERAKLVEELLALEHDFTVDEEIVRDPDLAHYARNEAEAREKWRKLVKLDLLSLKADGTEGEEAVQKLQKRYRSRFLRMHQIDNQELLEMSLTALTTAYDPHSSYMSPRTVDNFEILMKLKLEGIGAALQSVDGETVVKRIIPGGAADKDGRLKVEDRIFGVGQDKEGEIEDVVDMKLSDVVAKIRGKAGTVVRLEVISEDSPERKVIDITRARIELKDAEAQYEIIDDAGKKPDGQPYKIGVIDLDSFYMDMEGARRGLLDYKSTTGDVRRILDEFNKQKIDAVILDLRTNGGGSLQEAINLTGLFIDQGPVVQVKNANGHVQPYRDYDTGAVWNGPLVVLINKFSASASEILAGAIQDYQRGLIVGDRATHGKGTVQSLMDLGQQLFRVPNAPDDYGALKLTVQQFYRPNGDSTQNRGVLADIELPSVTTHLDVGEADLDYALPFDRVKPAEFEKSNRLDESVIDRLSYLSSQRRKNSEDFQEVLKKVDRYLQRKEKKTVPLNEAKFMAEIEERKADKEEQKKIEEMVDPGKSGVKRDYYLNEALAITADYLQVNMVAHTN